MFLLLSIFLVALALVLVLKFAAFLLREKALLNREEMSSYECGFEHHNVSRVPFSLRYFFLTLIFLLFDLEIVLMMFIPFIIYSVNFYIRMLVLTVFLFILLFSLYYE